MKKFLLEATEDSPMVLLDAEKGSMLLKGRSFMEDITPFQTIIIDWFREYIQNPQPHNLLEIELEYINASSHNMILNILEEVNKYHIMGYNFEVIWRHHEDDEYLTELGQAFSEIFDVPVKKQVLV